VLETYAFLATFTLQILAGSVLCPALFIRRVRPNVASIAAERFVTRHRTLNLGIALLGLVLLAWLFNYMRRPGWNEVTILVLITAYLLAQLSPQYLLSRKIARYNKKLKASVKEGKRKALLQRRGLFDFVSPGVLVVAALTYVLFTALVVYVRQHPFPASGGFINLGVVTLVYAFCAIVGFGTLYGKKRNPLETHADRLYAMSVIVNTLVYTCIAATVFTALDLTLGLLHLEQWGLFAVSVFFLICVLAPHLLSEIARRRQSGHGRGSNDLLPPGNRDLSANP
jgi:hypothetical protein